GADRPAAGGPLSRQRRAGRGALAGAPGPGPAPPPPDRGPLEGGTGTAPPPAGRLLGASSASPLGRPLRDEPSPTSFSAPPTGDSTGGSPSGDRREASDTGLAETGGEASDGSVLAATPDEALQFATDEQLGALPFVPSWSAREKVAVELEVLGLNVSAHPLDFVRAELTALDAVPFGRLHLVPN